MEVGVLGALTLRDSQGEIAVAGAKRRGVLARLIVDLGRPVHADRLLDDLWFDLGESVTPATLQSHIAQIRHRIGGAKITTNGSYYTFVPDDIVIDGQVVEAEILAAHSSFAARDPRTACTTARRALGRWRGQAYAEFRDSPWAMNEAERLDELAASGRDLVGDALLATGEAHQASLEMRAAVVVAPFREGSWARLVVALYRSHRQVEALRACRELRDNLAAGAIEPSAEIRKLEFAVLSQNETLWDWEFASGKTAPNSEATGQISPSAKASASDHSQTAPVASRRQVTVVEAQLADAARLARTLELEEYAALTTAFRDATSAVLRQGGGVVISRSAERVVGCFGARSASEQETVLAAGAAAKILESTSALRSSDGAPLLARIGIATGPAVVGYGTGGDEFEVLGPTPTLASLLANRAAPGAIVVTETTRFALEGWAECELWEDTGLDTASAKTRLFQLVAMASDIGRFQASVKRGLLPLVGRTNELRTIHDAWFEAASGNQQAVLIVGDAGVGKTRLVDAALNSIGVGHSNRFEFRCTAEHTATPLFPIVQYFAKASPESLSALLAAAEYESDAQALRELLGFSEGQSTNTQPSNNETSRSWRLRRERALDVVATFIERTSDGRPCVIVFDDAQWVDATTQNWFQSVLSERKIPRLLVILTCRTSEFAVSLAAANVRIVPLECLSDSESLVLVRSATDGHRVSNTTLREICSRSDGVPLNIEEFARWVTAQGAAQSVTSRPLEIPSSLQDSLMSRLDSMPVERRVLQQAAVCGREIDVAVLAAATGATIAAVGDYCERLVEVGALERRSFGEDAAYRFRHALVHDAAYESMLTDDRSQLHERIARSLMVVRSGVEQTDPELLARHFEGAGNYVEAVRYWRRAAKLNDQKSALTEAIVALRRATWLLQRPDATREDATSELKVLFALAPLLHRRDGAADDEFAVVTNRAVLLAEQYGGAIEKALALTMVWGRALALGDYPAMKVAAFELERTANEAGDRLLRVIAHQYNATVALHAGEIVDAEQQANTAIDLYQPSFRSAFAAAGSFDPGFTAQAELAYCEWHTGRFDDAWNRVEAMYSMQESGELGPFMAAFTTVTMAVFAWLRADSRTAQTASERAFAIADEHELDFPLILARWTLSWVIASDDPERALVIVDEALADAQRLGFLAHARGYLIRAEILQRLGRTDDAYRTFESGRKVFDRTQEMREAPQLWSAEAAMRLSLGDDLVLAAQHARTAIQLAEQSNSFAHRLRALVTLAEIEPFNSEVHAALRGAYTQLTQGFADPYVIKAGLLLQR